jgi:hypothetical protein
VVHPDYETQAWVASSQLSHVPHALGDFDRAPQSAGRNFRAEVLTNFIVVEMCPRFSVRLNKHHRSGGGMLADVYIHESPLKWCLVDIFRNVAATGDDGHNGGLKNQSGGMPWPQPRGAWTSLMSRMECQRKLVSGWGCTRGMAACPSCLQAEKRASPQETSDLCNSSIDLLIRADLPRHDLTL